MLVKVYTTNSPVNSLDKSLNYTGDFSYILGQLEDVITLVLSKPLTTDNIVKINDVYYYVSDVEKTFNGLTKVTIKKDYLLTYQDELKKGEYHLTQSSKPDETTLQYNVLNEKEVVKIDSDVNLEPTNDFILRTWG
ncbi:MAG: hypothetical protein MJ250_08485 [Alphaproteobacteria bacterium]|nr:hypothetical protein [Alphaproteobacteria bacterium]